MAIVGSMESGLTGDHQTLFAKAVLDGITAVVFTATMGLGVMLSAVSVFIYQGMITGGALMLKPLLVPEVLDDPGIYPTEEVFRRLFVPAVLSPKEERFRNRAWARIKSGI